MLFCSPASNPSGIRNLVLQSLLRFVYEKCLEMNFDWSVARHKFKVLKNKPAYLHLSAA